MRSPRGNNHHRNGRESSAGESETMMGSRDRLVSLLFALLLARVAEAGPPAAARRRSGAVIARAVVPLTCGPIRHGSTRQRYNCTFTAPEPVPLRRRCWQQVPDHGRAVDEAAPRPLLPHCKSTPPSKHETYATFPESRAPVTYICWGEE